MGSPIPPTTQPAKSTAPWPLRSRAKRDLPLRFRSPRRRSAAIRIWGDDHDLRRHRRGGAGDEPAREGSPSRPTTRPATSTRRRSSRTARPATRTSSPPTPTTPTTRSTRPWSVLARCRDHASALRPERQRLLLGVGERPHFGTWQCPTTWQVGWITAPPSPTSLYSTTPTANQANNVTTAFYNADGDEVQNDQPRRGDIHHRLRRRRPHLLHLGPGERGRLAHRPLVEHVSRICARARRRRPCPPSVRCPTTRRPSTTRPGSPLSQPTSTATPRVMPTTRPASRARRPTPSRKPCSATTTRTPPDSAPTALPRRVGPGVISTPRRSRAGRPRPTPITGAAPPTSTASPAGTTTDAYDALGDLTSETYSGTAAGYSAPHNVSYTYYVDGTRAPMTDGTGTTTYTYDATGDITTQAFSAGSGSGLTSNTSLRRTFRPDARLGRLSPLHGLRAPTVDYAYDATGTMASETDWLGNKATFSHDGDGNQTAQDNDVSTSTPRGTSSRAVPTTTPTSTPRPPRPSPRPGEAARHSPSRSPGSCGVATTPTASSPQRLRPTAAPARARRVTSATTPTDRTDGSSTRDRSRRERTPTTSSTTRAPSRPRSRATTRAATSTPMTRPSTRPRR